MITMLMHLNLTYLRARIKEAMKRSEATYSKAVSVASKKSEPNKVENAYSNKKYAKGMLNLDVPTNYGAEKVKSTLPYDGFSASTVPC